MKVEISELRAAILAILEYAESGAKGGQVEVDEDLYWFIQKEELFDPCRTPERMTLGSLEDDWKAIVAVAQKQDDPFGYHAVWASTILRAIGDRTL